MTEYRSGTLRKSFEELQHIPKLDLNSINYYLPPSKSHMIRILALAAINQGVCNIRLNGILGNDIESMIYSLQSIGVNITKQFGKRVTIVTIYGVGKDGFSSLNSSVDCGNSGTALRIVMGLISSMRDEITLFGDESLSKRYNQSMINSLMDADVLVEKTTDSNLPLKIKGPWFGDSHTNKIITLDCSKSSQPLTSWMISSALFPCNVDLRLLGPAVSNRHYLLTKELCNRYGADILATDFGYRLNKWEVSLPDEITIPGDSSMASFAILLCKLHTCNLQLSNWPENNDSLGNEILRDSAKYLGISWDDNAINSLNKGEYSSYDLTDCNDLITPLAVTISLAGGGEITGISHTIYKESNRIESTLKLMDNFGLKGIFDGQKIIIEGGQELIKPTLPVDCYDDHRIFMTAAILMTKYGGDIIGKGLHSIADFDFLNRLGI